MTAYVGGELEKKLMTMRVESGNTALEGGTEYFSCFAGSQAAPIHPSF
jgi:hypothetical protein